MNAPDSPDFSFNTLTGMLEPLKNTRRDKMRQNETVCALGLPTNGGRGGWRTYSNLIA